MCVCVCVFVLYYGDSPPIFHGEIAVLHVAVYVAYTLVQRIFLVHYNHPGSHRRG